MRSRFLRTSGAGIAIALASALAAATASAEQLVGDLQLTSHRPATASGATLRLIWPSDGPGGKPKPEVKGVFEFPAGTQINEAAVPTCTASDTEFKLEGTAACPSDTFLGPGAVSVLTGFGPPVDPVMLDDYWFHGPGEFVAVFTEPGTRAPGVNVNRVKIQPPATLIAEPALPPGYPPGTKTVPKQSDQAVRRLVSRAGAFITTPPTCPADGQWISHVTITYDDGSVDTATAATRCQP